MAEYGAAALNLGITRSLAQFLSEFRFQDLSAEAIHCARRGVLEWLGCALAGSGHTTIDKLLTVLEAAGGKPTSTVLGRSKQLVCLMHQSPTARWGTCSISTTPTWAASSCTPVRPC